MDHRDATYDEDIYAWSRHQAAVLRGLTTRRRELPNDLDLEHVAEEIEDLGKSALRAVLSHLRQMLVHALKILSSPAADPVAGWKTEILDHQALAGDHYTASMRKDIDPDDLWRRACRDAERVLAIHGETLAPVPAACPLTLDDLLDEDLAPDDLVARIAAAAGGPAR